MPIDGRIGMDAPQKIVIRMPNWLGDMVMATALLSQIKKALPKTSITLMCREPLSSLFLKDPRVDEIFAFSEKTFSFRGKNKEKDRLKVLQMGRFDLGLLLTNSFSSAWEFFQARIPKRIGFAKEGRSLLLTKAISFPKELEKKHLCDVYKELLTPLGISAAECGPSLYIEESEKNEARKKLEKFGVQPSDSLIGIHPGAAYGSAKCWLPERFQEVIRDLLASSPYYKIALFGEFTSFSLIEKIAEGFAERVINLCGKTTLRELSSLISVCDVFLTNDSGPMHLADALGTKVVALFGSTNPIKTGPYYQKKVIKKNVFCSPCYKRVCPLDFRCMKEISSKEVYDEIAKLLEKKSYV